MIDIRKHISVVRPYLPSEEEHVLGGKRLMKHKYHESKIMRTRIHEKEKRADDVIESDVLYFKLLFLYIKVIKIFISQNLVI